MDGLLWASKGEDDGSTGASVGGGDGCGTRIRGRDTSTGVARVFRGVLGATGAVPGVGVDGVALGIGSRIDMVGGDSGGGPVWGAETVT